MIDPAGLMMIEPQGPCAAVPEVDELTRKMTAAYRASRARTFYRGFHEARCGAVSDNIQHLVGDLPTNSLAIHYLAYHRDEVPEIELAKVASLTYGEAEPTEPELAGKWGA